MKNRIIAMLMVIVMTISLVPSMMLNASAADVSQPTFSVESTWAVAGSTIEVNVNIDNNPGLYGATLNISWSEGLTLVDVQVKDGKAVARAQGVALDVSRIIVG